MKDILTAPFLTELCEMTANMYRLGWDERNGGNISQLLDPMEVAEYLDLDASLRRIPLQFDASSLAGRIFIVTGTGKYFKNVKKNPEENLGILRIAENGREAELLWGFSGGGAPTSEFPTHLMSHAARLKADPEHRVVMHCHPVNTIALTFVCPADEREITRTLWGIFGVGHNLDEAFGLIETVEKAAEIYMKIAPLEIKNRIPEEQLGALAEQFHVIPRKGYL